MPVAVNVADLIAQQVACPDTGTSPSSLLALLGVGRGGGVELKTFQIVVNLVTRTGLPSFTSVCGKHANRLLLKGMASKWPCLIQQFPGNIITHHLTGRFMSIAPLQVAHAACTIQEESLRLTENALQHWGTRLQSAICPC